MQTSAEPTLQAGAAVPREDIWNIPNAITLLRIALAPLLLLMLWFHGPFWSTVIGLGFLAVSLTDLLDGYLARRTASITRIGKLLDPLADKILVMTAIVVLVAVDRVPPWAVPLLVVILGRELAVTGLRSMAAAEGVVMPAAAMGRWKTGFQIAAITVLLVDPGLLGLPMHGLGLGLLGIAGVLTFWSGYTYFATYLGERDVPDP